MRIISRLDIKGPNLIKGVQLEGLRIIGDPLDFVKRYYDDGVDEIILMDAVASLYGRNNLFDLVSYITKEAFIPITLGGGIRSVTDAEAALKSGADKIAVNSAAIQRPDLITEIAEFAGSQAVVLSVEAKKVGSLYWEAYYNNGREKSGRGVKDWIIEGIERGAGEILLTSIDNEGTRKGLDMDLYSYVSEMPQNPLIASGGVGDIEHILEGSSNPNIDAVAIADLFHYGRSSVKELKLALLEAGLKVRPPVE